MTATPWDTPVPEADPFAEFEKTPSLSFAEAQPGTVFTGVVTEAPKEVQQRDIKTKEPATWPDGNPKMAVVIGLEVDGTRYSVWAPRSRKPGSLFTALADAQKQAHARIAVGGRLSIKFTGTEKSSVAGFNDRKLYAAKYEPNDPFADGPSAEGNGTTAQPASQAAPPF